MITRGLMVALAWCCCASAGLAESLYEARVPVTGQQERERTRALQAAFGQVLVKVTGQRETPQAGAVADALRQPMRYVQQFRYLPLPEDDRAQSLREEGYLELLSVSFDDAAVNRLLQDAGIPLWGRTRPATLLWLAVEDGGDRWLLGGGDARSGVRATVERAAHARGIPVLLPLMDLEDRRALHFTDVWGNFRDVMLRASERYQPGAVLAGRLLLGSGGVSTARWSLYHDGGADHWETGPGDGDSLVGAGIDGAADRLALRHARVISEDGRLLVDLVVTDVRGIDGYDRALGYLGGLDPVEHVEVARVEQDRVRFRLTLSGERDDLVRVIGFGSALVPAVSGAAATERGDVRELTYRLLP